jgi:hypothetical protein
MTVTMPTNTIPNSQPAKPEQPRPQAQEDLAGLHGPLGQQSQASSQRTAPGRRPLFRN